MVYAARVMAVYSLTTPASVTEQQYRNADLSDRPTSRLEGLRTIAGTGAVAYLASAGGGVRPTRCGAVGATSIIQGWESCVFHELT